MQLGPSGHPFEEYIGDILTAKGYDTKVSQILRGACITHEVDVIARTDSRHIMIECKFHNAPGTKSDVQTALYTHARFMDIRRGDKGNLEHERPCTSNGSSPIRNARQTPSRTRAAPV